MKLQVIFPHAAAIFMMAVAGSSLAAESPGAEQAKDLLNKAVAYLEKEGSARAFCAFNDPSGDFHGGLGGSGPGPCDRTGARPHRARDVKDSDRLRG